jgi:hypothetical protein
MPQILEETTIDLDRADLLSRSPIARSVSSRGRLIEPVRTKGIHLSGVLRYVAIESGLMKVAESIEEEELLPLRMALGLAWEEFAVSLYPEIYWQPGELSPEGIAMTCDGHSFIVDRGSLCIEEFKLTWKKVRSGDELLRDEWYWMQQGRGYCWGYDARFIRWHCCYVNGDYRGSGPIYKRYLVSLSDSDVESTRSLILKNKDRAIAKGYAE